MPTKSSLPEASPEPELRCYVVTGLTDSSLVNELLRQAKMQGFSGSPVSHEVQLPPYHWIIVPHKDRASAMKELRRLQRQGIDSYLVTSGSQRNAISLGIFEHERSATDLLRRMKSKGLAAEEVPYERRQTVYHVQFDHVSTAQDQWLKAQVNQLQKNADEIQIIPCPGVASISKST